MLAPEPTDVGLVVSLQEKERDKFGVTVVKKEERGMLVDFDEKTARVVFDRTFPRAITVSLESLSWPRKSQRISVAKPFQNFMAKFMSDRRLHRLEVIDCVDRATGKIVPILAEVEHGAQGRATMTPVARMFTDAENNKYYPVATDGDWTYTRKE